MLILVFALRYALLCIVTRLISDVHFHITGPKLTFNSLKYLHAGTHNQNYRSGQIKWCILVWDKIQIFGLFLRCHVTVQLYFWGIDIFPYSRHKREIYVFFAYNDLHASFRFKWGCGKTHWHNFKWFCVVVKHFGLEVVCQIWKYFIS